MSDLIVGQPGRMRLALAAVTEAVRRLVFNWKTLLLAYLLYGLLLGLIYFFVTTREATMIQVLLGIVVLPILVIVLFFFLQALGLHLPRLGAGPLIKLRLALADSLRLLLATIPLALVVWLILGGFDRLGEWFAGGDGDGSSRLSGVIDRAQSIVILILPLCAIHIWIVTVRRGAVAGIRSIWKDLPRIFAPVGIVIYAVIAGLTTLLAWICLFNRPPVDQEWIELYLFGARVVLGLTIIFFGWLLLLGSIWEHTAQLDLREVDQAGSPDHS